MLLLLSGRFQFARFSQCIRSRRWSPSGSMHVDLIRSLLAMGKTRMLPHGLVSSTRHAPLLAAVVALAWLGVSLPAVAFGPPPNAPLSLEKLSRIDAFLNDQVAQGEIPGAIVLIQRHGKPVYFKWFGKRDVDAKIDMTRDTIFPLHSLTKTITSFAAMMLVDRGKI